MASSSSSSSQPKARKVLQRIGRRTATRSAGRASTPRLRPFFSFAPKKYLFADLSLSFQLLLILSPTHFMHDFHQIKLALSRTLSLALSRTHSLSLPLLLSFSYLLTLIPSLPIISTFLLASSNLNISLTLPLSSLLSPSLSPSLPISF